MECLYAFGGEEITKSVTLGFTFTSTEVKVFFERLPDRKGRLFFYRNKSLIREGKG
jgi:hypothetical protein